MRLAALVTVLVLAAGPLGAQAPGLQEIASGLENPVYLTHAGDGSGRLFIVEQAGRIRIFRDGALHKTPFLDIARVIRSGGERGLLSIAFHPEFARTGFLYVK